MNIVPVNNEYHLEYSKELEELLRNEGFRVEMDAREEKLSYRMRESQTRKIPLTLIVGDKERDEKTISYRLFGTTETTTLSREEFVAFVKDLIVNKK